MCGLRKSLPCQFSFSSRHREIVGTYYWLLCGCFGVLFDELHAFHAHFNLRSRQFLDCFSFGICKVRDTAGRKLKRVQIILNEWCLGTALAWLGLNLKTNQKTVCYTGYANCHFSSSPKHDLPHIYDEYYPFSDSTNFVCLVGNYIKFHWCAYIKEAVGLKQFRLFPLSFSKYPAKISFHQKKITHFDWCPWFNNFFSEFLNDFSVQCF